jgi:hypothetical protein
MIGDPIWIPSSSTLYYPSAKYCTKYKFIAAPICAWFVEQTDDKCSKVMYDNVYWSVESEDLYPYPQPQEQK